MSSLIARASGECSIRQQVQFKHEKIYIQSSKTSQTRGGPESQSAKYRSQRDARIGSNRAVNQSVDQAFNISKTSNRVVHISRHQISWTANKF